MYSDIAHSDSFADNAGSCCGELDAALTTPPVAPLKVKVSRS